MADEPAQEQDTPVPVQAPMYYASTVGLESAGNDFTLTFLRSRPVVGEIDGQKVALQEAQAIISFSPQTLKDLWILLGDALPAWEKDFGEIVTAYSKARKAK